MKLIFVCIDYRVKHLVLRVRKDFDVQKWADDRKDSFNLLGITHIEVEEI